MVCSKVIELARLFRMHVGYVEFNDDVIKFVLDKSRMFFSREYATLLRQVSWAKSKGCTNYEGPLNVALSELDFQEAQLESSRSPQPRVTVTKTSRHMLDTPSNRKAACCNVRSI